MTDPTLDPAPSAEPDETERRRQLAIQKVAPSELHRVLLQTSSLPHELLVPCWPWRYGSSGGHPIMRAGDAARHPVKFLLPHSTRIRRICTDKSCCNPRHFVSVPRPETAIQHGLVFHCEEMIDDFDTLDAAYAGIPYPRIHVLEAWRNKIQLRLIHHEHPASSGSA